MDPARLRAFAVFAGLPEAELLELAAAMSEVEAEAGEVVVARGDFGYAINAIEQGEADVVLEGGEAGETLGPGDAFGEIAFFVTERRTASVVARTPMKLLRLFAQDFHRIRARVPDLERSLRRLGGERLSR